MSIHLATSIQLALRAPQDRYLTTDPQLSFFQPSWKRHTAYGRECKEELLFTGLKFGATSARAAISRQGDMLGDVALQITLPIIRNAAGTAVAGTWNDAIGYLLLRRMRLRIGEVLVHDQERLWYHMSDQLFMPHGKLQALDGMIGRGATLSTTQQHTLFVPFKFLCCKDHRGSQQFLPLLAITNAPITVELDTEAFASCVSPEVIAAGGVEPPDLDATLLCDIYYLDTEERASLLKSIVTDPITLQFEQHQDMEAMAFAATSDGTRVLPAVSVDLSELNVPTKLLAAVAYDQAYDAPFTFKPAIDTMYLEFNTKERFEARPSAYFQLAQRYDYVGRAARDNILAYSFALDAAAPQASGAVNFSMLETPRLKATLDTTVVTDGTRVVVKVFSVSYNWLICHNGAVQIKFQQ